MKNLQPAAPFPALVKHIAKINCFSLPDRIILLFVVFVLLVPASTSCFASKSCVTADCHTNMGKVKFVHDPVTGGECDACHTETGKTHPGEDGAFELTEQGPPLCFQCHEDIRDSLHRQHVHPPVWKRGVIFVMIPTVRTIKHSCIRPRLTCVKNVMRRRTQSSTRILPTQNSNMHLWKKVDVPTVINRIHQITNPCSRLLQKYSA